MAWKKVVLRGDNATTEQLLLDEEEVVAADDSIAFVDNSDSNYIKRESIVDFANKIAGDALDTDDDGVIDLSVAGLNPNTINDTNNDLVLVWDHTESAWTTASLGDVGSAGTSGVTSITSNNGLSVNANATGAVSIELDTSTLSAQTVSSTTEFIVSNSGTEGVAAASAIGLQHFDNTTSAFIDLGDLSVGTDGTASGGGGLDYNSATGVFTYTPPDLSSYITTDRFASAFSYTGGTTSGPTGTLTITGGNNVSFGAIPSASVSTSGVVTTGAQTFAGNKTFNNNVIVTGDLTVSGATTTVDTTNLLVSDTFIALNSGGVTNVDAGIVFEGADNKVFGWDQSQESGRFGVDYTGGNAGIAGGNFAPDAWISTVHTAAGDSGSATAALAQIGNIYIDSTNSDIYIYA